MKNAKIVWERERARIVEIEHGLTGETMWLVEYVDGFDCMGQKRWRQLPGDDSINEIAISGADIIAATEESDRRVKEVLQRTTHSRSLDLGE